MMRSVLRTVRVLYSLTAAHTIGRQLLLAFFFLLSILTISSFTSPTLRAQFSFKNFSIVDSLCFQRDAKLIQDTIRLSPDVINSVGAIWYRSKQEVASGFTTRFRFRMGMPGTFQEADGIAFVIQNFDSCTYGNIAQGIGYEGIPNSLAVEFDTWFNEEYDPDSNHISIQTGGIFSNSAGFDATLAGVSGIPILGMGNEHTAIIDYKNSRLQVFLDSCERPILEAYVNLDSLLMLDNGQAWVGLTSATGNHHQDHDLFSWEFQPGKRRIVKGCSGDKIILEGPEGFSHYRWSTGDTTRTLAVNANGDYHLFIKDWFLCSDNDPQFSYHVSIYNRTYFPHLAPLGTHYLCPGDSILLSVPVRPTAKETVIWSTGAIGPSLLAKKSGKYSALILDTNGCVYLLDTVEVVVRPHPEPIILPSDSISLCKGDSVFLYLENEFPEYLWSTGERTSKIVVFDPGVYTVEVVDHDGCTGYDTIRVLPAEDVLYASSDTAICPGEDVQLTVSGRTEYRWSPSTGLSCADCPDPIASPKETTTYIVQGTNNGVCLGYDTVVVTVRSPNVEIGNDTTICFGEHVPLHPKGGVSYRWSPLLDLSCFNCSDPIATPYESITYYVDAVDEWGCTARDSIRITVLRPGVVKASGDTSFCIGGTAQLRGVGVAKYQWYPADDLSCVDCPNPVAVPSRTMTYYVRGTGADGRCESIDSVRVVVNSFPAIDAGAEVAACPGESVQLIPSGGAAYRWLPSSDLSCLDCPGPIARPAQTTTYYVIGISPEGCEAIDSVRVIVHAPLSVWAGEDISICAGDQGALQAEGGIRWLWEPSAGLSCVDCANPIANPSRTTRYHLTAWSEDGCQAVDSVEVAVGEHPDIIHLTIARNYRGYPDQRRVIAVEAPDLDQITDIREIEFELEYDPGVAFVSGSSVEQLLAGTLLEGWSVEVIRNVPGHLIFRVTSPSGQTLSGKRGVGIQELLRFEARLYLSNVRGSELTFSARSSSNCFSFDTARGYAQLDSLCGLNFRLIELSANKYVPPIAYPNPARDRVTFEFGLGLDGPTKLEVFDLRGDRVGLMVDDVLREGKYSVEWDVRSVPSGLYLYRLSSGAWSQTGQVRVGE